MIVMEINNKKANYEYFVEDSIECGIELKGTEIKSIRNGSADITDCFAIIKNNEVFLLNMHKDQLLLHHQFLHIQQ